MLFMLFMLFASLAHFTCNILCCSRGNQVCSISLFSVLYSVQLAWVINYSVIHVQSYYGSCGLNYGPASKICI